VEVRPVGFEVVAGWFAAWAAASLLATSIGENGLFAPAEFGAGATAAEVPEEEAPFPWVAPRTDDPGRIISVQTTNTIGNTQSALRLDGTGDISHGDEAW
jgi:hypothetical protein